MKFINIFKILILYIIFFCFFNESTLDAFEKKNTVYFTSSSKIFSLKEIWKISLNIEKNSSFHHLRPILYNTTIIAAQRNGIIISIDIKTGKINWKIQLFEKKKSWNFNKKKVFLSLGLEKDNKNIYVGSEKEKIYAININNGTISWEKKVSGEILSYPVTSNKKIFIYTNDGFLKGLNQFDGDIIWQIYMGIKDISIHGFCTPLLYKNLGIIGTENGYVIIFKLETGEIIWKKKITKNNSNSSNFLLEDIDITPILLNNILYIACYNGLIVALDLPNGKISWKKQEANTIRNMIHNDHFLYIIYNNDYISCIDIETGNRIWTQKKLLNYKINNPIAYENYLLITDKEGYFYIIKKEDGKISFKKKISKFNIENLLLNQNKLFMQTEGGEIYFFEIKVK